MKRAKTARAARAVTPPQNAKRAPRCGAALSPFLFLNPLGNYPDFVFGVLRRTYNDRTNTAEGFVRGKLHPISDPGPGAQWAPTCHRWDVILPPAAPDDLLEPRRLAASFDEHALSWKSGLLTYLTLRFPGEARTHPSFEMTRAFACEIVRTRKMAVLVVQHAPFASGSANPLHSHLVLFPRMLSAWFSVYDDELLHDQAQDDLFREWSEFRSRL